MLNYYDSLESLTGEQCKVSEALDGIKRVVGRTYKCIPNYRVGNYKLDLYIPELSLAIQVERYGHAYYNSEEYRRRELLIEEQVGCYTFWFNPYSKYYNLFDVIGDLVRTISELDD